MLLAIASYLMLPTAFFIRSMGLFSPRSFLPVILFAIVGLGLAIGFVLSERVAVVQWGFGYCQKCGYDLRGLQSDRCPECGCPVKESPRGS